MNGNPYPDIKAYEREAFDQFDIYLNALDAGGWTEQSYCTDWQVYQVVSHIGSGSRIGALRIRAWTGAGAPITRELMQQVWGHFDSLGPTEMLSAYREAAAEYRDAESSTPDDAGLQEVDGFAGKRPLWAYQVSRVWELACHTWDVYVAHDRAARLDPLAVDLLAANLNQTFLPLDRARASELPPTRFTLTDSDRTYLLDPSAERPRLIPDAATDAQLGIAGPDEEVIRLVSGRHFLPGTQSHLKLTRGTPQELAKLGRAFR